MKQSAAAGNNGTVIGVPANFPEIRYLRRKAETQVSFRTQQRLRSVERIHISPESCSHRQETRGTEASQIITDLQHRKIKLTMFSVPLLQIALFRVKNPLFPHIRPLSTCVTGPAKALNCCSALLLCCRRARVRRKLCGSRIGTAEMKAVRGLQFI